jgi:hypothetical protein
VLEDATNVWNRDKPTLLIEMHELDRFKEQHLALLKLQDHNYPLRSLGVREWHEHFIAEPLGRF